MAWDDAENRPAGSTLFQSAALSTNHVYSSSNGWHRFDIAIPMLELTPGASYIAMLTRHGQTSSSSDVDMVLGSRLVTSPNGRYWRGS
jgi:hypothetical protein